MNFRFSYDPYNASDPLGHPGQLRVGYRVAGGTFYGHYGMLNSEARIISYIGIARGQLPLEHYYRMYRTLPEIVPQEQRPRGEAREYNGVKVFEGSYEYRGIRIVPSWGGSMFEALMVPLFVPEDTWAPGSWGLNHPHYVQAQKTHGLEEASYGYWGFSPASSPRGAYQVFGVNALGAWSDGYLSYEVGPPVSALSGSQASKVRHGIVTPYASFLALRYAPHAAIANLGALCRDFSIYSKLGFLDSVDVSTGAASGSVLAVDQGMIMTAVANALANDAMQHAFSDGLIEQAIRPLVAQEEFFDGTAGRSLAVHQTRNDAPDRGTGAK
jgi:hypothetical protein